MGIKVTVAIFKSLIKIRNYVVSVILGSDYFIPLALNFKGYCPIAPVLDLRDENFRVISHLSDFEQMCLEHIQSKGLLSDFIEPDTVSVLPLVLCKNSVQSIIAGNLSSVSKLTFLAYVNLTSMLGIRMLFELCDKTQCLSCHKLESLCTCIVYKFSYLQDLTCLCSASSHLSNCISLCSCNGIPAMIRDLDEFSKILDAISLMIVDTSDSEKSGNHKQMRSKTNGPEVTARAMWRCSRMADVVSGINHCEKWDFRPP